MKHPTEENISAMVDGMLPVAETRRMAAHLSECETCRGTFQAFSDVKSFVRSSGSVAQPPEQFWSDAYRKVRLDAASPSNRPVRNWGLSPRSLIGGLAAAAALSTIMLVAPLANKPSVLTPAPVFAQDSLDVEDVSTFVFNHTSSAASQPLGDRDRQRLISADTNIQFADNSTSGTAGNEESSL